MPLRRAKSDGNAQEMRQVHCQLSAQTVQLRRASGIAVRRNCRQRMGLFRRRPPSEGSSKSNSGAGSESAGQRQAA